MVYGEDVVMTIKFIGAVFVILGCGAYGFLIALSHKNEETSLRQFLSVLDYIECDIRYRLTPLPDLCRKAAAITGGALRNVFSILASEFDGQISPDAKSCVAAALEKSKNLPKLTRGAMELLGNALGCFDLEGQLIGIEAVRNESRRILDIYTNNQDVRLRSYQTLGLCAGAAIAIIFI